MSDLRPIKGYEGEYAINEAGEVWYVGGSERARKRGYGTAPKKQAVDRQGYARVTLSLCGKSTQKLVHNMLAEAFLDKPSEAYLVDHIDGDRLNNSLTNLRWVTQKENQLNRHTAVASSGVTGVHRIKGSTLRPWMACGKLDGVQVYLGVFQTLEEAVAARAAWEQEVGARTAINTGAAAK